MAHVIRSLLGGLVFFAALALPAWADPTYPAFTGLVVDAAHILSESDVAALTRKLTDLQTKTGVQFAVATVPSLEGLEIEPYSIGLARSWKVGQKGANNGLLLLLAPNERRLRFEIGRGLEGTMTDLQSKLITRNTMVPKLKAGDPAGALKAGVDDAILVLTNDKAGLPDRLKQDPAAADDTGSGVVWFIVLLIIFVVVINIIRRRGGGGSGWGGWATGAAIGSVTNNRSSSDSSSNGDSFSGGGGGDFGGGGASDSY